jgi:hypothetical protein
MRRPAVPQPLLPSVTVDPAAADRYAALDGSTRTTAAAEANRLFTDGSSGAGVPDGVTDGVKDAVAVLV